MTDILGHIFYVILLCGVILLSRKKRIGWLVCIVAQIGWLALGVVMEITSIWAWSGVFVVWDGYGYWNWKHGK